MTTVIHPPTECARLGADAVRQLNHHTIWPNDDRGYRYPCDVYDTLGALSELVARLPQALDQMAGYLNRALTAERVSDADGLDPAPIVAGIVALLGEAAEHLGATLTALDYAHNATATLGWVEQ